MNLADYFTKHHPPAHHHDMWGEFLMHVAELQQLRQKKITMETIVMTDGNIFPKLSARVY